MDSDHISDESIAPRCAGGTGSTDCRPRRIRAEYGVTLAAIPWTRTSDVGVAGLTLQVCLKKAEVRGREEKIEPRDIFTRPSFPPKIRVPASLRPCRHTPTTTVCL